MHFHLLIGIAALHVAVSGAPRKDLADPLRSKTFDWHKWLDQYMMEWVTGNKSDVFAAKIFKEVGKSISGDLVFSPFIVYEMLSMMVHGASGKTANSMNSVLGFPSDFWTAANGFQRVLNSFKSYKKVELSVANKIFLPIDAELVSRFSDVTRTYYNSGTQQLNFAKSEEARGIINQWCENQTNHRIKGIIAPNDIDANTGVVIVSALYFKGKWKEPFTPEATQLDPFYVAGGEVKQVPTMFSSSEYNYGEFPGGDAVFIEIPYESEDADRDISMFIILPDKIEGLAELDKKIAKFSVSELTESGNMTQLEVYLPKFKIETTIPLRGPLEQLGLADMFTDAADFSGIVKGRTMKVSKIIQKAFIEVNEEGSEAGAANAADLSNRFLPKEFRANRPFLAIIATKGPNPVNLFTARYTAQ